MKRLYESLYRNWVCAALCMGIFLFLLMPVLSLYWSTSLLLVFLQAPVYMIHQVEEHTGDRFREFVNRQMFGGVEALNPASILWINIPGVWGLSLISLYAAAFFGIGWGLASVYLVAVNAVGHIVGAAAKRTYNPGLYTSILLFVPASGAAFWVLASDPAVTAIHHVVGLAAAVAIHVAIVVYAKAQASRYRQSAAAPARPASAP
jgi:hypothetical protein